MIAVLPFPGCPQNRFTVFSNSIPGTSSPGMGGTGCFSARSIRPFQPFDLFLVLPRLHGELYQLGHVYRIMRTVELVKSQRLHQQVVLGESLHTATQCLVHPVVAGAALPHLIIKTAGCALPCAANGGWKAPLPDWLTIAAQVVKDNAGAVAPNVEILKGDTSGRPLKNSGASIIQCCPLGVFSICVSGGIQSL